MHGVRLLVAYEGTAFAGWQRQPTERTVQGELERAIGEITGTQVTLRGAGRTDAGVHAEGQVAAFDTPRELPLHGWVRGLNGKLPPDVAVRAAFACEPGYDPRFDAIDKTYRYVLHGAATRDPLWRDRAWHLGLRRARPRHGTRERFEDLLDVAAMRRAADVLVGEHDFAAFRSAKDERESTVRTLHEVRLVHPFAGREELLAIEVRGTAFLHNMVRILAGTLVEVGRERTSVERLQEILRGPATRADTGETAPPQGLYLVRVTLGRKSG
ncbi:MAG: tRNA pseudouridine(38-40) synthase TruA [Sandaracinaceae bacterium]|nr:tRNA pseudouridine(38-40) synthase TruA [Sandaracinaceae bacterium]